MSSCETFNCILSPHERCIRGDNNKNNNINVRNIHVAIKKNLNVFVGDSLDNCSVSGDDSTKAIPECSSSKSSVSYHRLSKTEESQHEVPSSSSLGSYPDPNYSNPGQPDKNSSKNETMVASSLVQIWEARTTQQPSSSNQNQSQIDSRTSSSGSNVLENSESLNEESELIQPIEKGNNEEEKEEEMESDSQFVPDCGEKEREGVVRVMDIIRKLSNDSETTANNDNGCDNGKEVQTTEAKSFPQVTCSPRIRGRQAFADLLVQMTRDREKELACLSDRHSVSKFTQRGRIQSTLRIRCYERCIAIQDRHRSKSSGAGSDINRSSRGSGVMHLLRDKYKKNSENIETRGRIMDKDPHKASEKKVVEETMEKIDVKEVQEVISAVETAKKAVLSQIVENKNDLKKSKNENAERRGEKREPNARESVEERGEKPETGKKAVLSESAEDKSGLKKSAGETIQKETKEKAIAKENVQGNGLVGIAEKVNLWNSEKKMNRRRWMEKGKTESKANPERVDKNDVLERSINTSRETLPPSEFAEKVVKEDCVSVETKSKEIGEEEKVLQEKESVEGNTLMGIAEKVNLWNSKEKRNRRRVMEKGKGKTHVKANEASRRIINVETAETSIAISKETVVGTQDKTMRCESEEIGRRKKEEEFSSLGAKSKDITEVKNINSQQGIPTQESARHGSLESAKEISSSPRGEEIIILPNPEAKSTKEIDRNNSQENRIEEESASDGSRETCKEKKNEEMSTMRNPDDVNGIKESEFVNDWYENEMEDDYDHYNGEYSTDWIYDISRPRSYWEELRKERYLEVLNTESDNKDICHLIQSRTVSNFLTSDLRQKIDNLMTNLVHSHLGVPINQEKSKEEEWIEECSARNQEDNETEEEPEKTNFETASDGCSRSSARSSTLMMSWSFRDQDTDKDQEPATPVSLPEPSVPTNQSTQEMQMISDLRGQMEQIQREMLELRNTVKSCVDMQLHFQKSLVAQDLSRSGSSAEQRVDKKNPLKRKCCVCSEMPVDSLLYRCGHMCTCLKCAHELQWSSKKCPICMAPIVDVVRAFLDA